MLLLDYARDEVGLPMKGLHIGKHFGWTTDAEKADRMRAAGAQVLAYAPTGWQRGWEISFSTHSHVREEEEVAV